MIILRFIPGLNAFSLLLVAACHLRSAEVIAVSEAGRSAQKMAVRQTGTITDEDRKWWAFQPLANVEPPLVYDNGWCRNEIDRFVFQKLADHGLQSAPMAEAGQLVRRIYHTMTGLPPTPEELDAFQLAAQSGQPVAAAALCDALLASPRYGEHWARHWLDLVRYAESDGYKSDDYRPNAWRYRDYVIAALNADKPYDRFVQEQLAGDELSPDDLHARTATGFLRHGIYEYNNRDVASQWTNMLNEVTDVTADVFLGLGMQCARCHDHKFDPILQRDYYRLQAFFAPLRLRDDFKLATPSQSADYEAKLRTWEESTRELRGQIASIEEPAKVKVADEAISKFPQEIQTVLRKPLAERNPWEKQIAELAFRQVIYEWDHLVNHLPAADRERYVNLQKQFACFANDKPAALPGVPCVSDIGTTAPGVTIPKKADQGEIEPGYLTVLDTETARIEPRPSSTGRRAALAKWITRPDNPLTARVIVNRVWHYHFGRGLVATTSDFGKLGGPPSHPELLDWLAGRFIADGWSLKKLHRLILTSATYQQATPPQPTTADSENKFPCRPTTRRLDAEQIRDAILLISGELKTEAGGPSVDWREPRRSVYTKVLRNTHDPLLEAFDAPESFSCVAERNVTTTPTQSLLMINHDWPVQRARAFANRLLRECLSDDIGRIILAYRLVFGRMPSDAETGDALGFLERQSALCPPDQDARVTALADFCHVLLNSNEFIYLD